MRDSGTISCIIYSLSSTLNAQSLTLSRWILLADFTSSRTGKERSSPTPSPVLSGETGAWGPSKEEKEEKAPCAVTFGPFGELVACHTAVSQRWFQVLRSSPPHRNEREFGFADHSQGNSLPS